MPLSPPTSTCSSRDTTAQSNSVHFRSPYPLGLLCNPEGPECRCVLVLHTVLIQVEVWIWLYQRLFCQVILEIWKQKKASICSVVRTGLFLSLQRFTAEIFVCKSRPLFNNAGCGDQNSNSRVTCHPLSPLSTEGGRCEIPGGRTVVPLLILLLILTNSPWCHPYSRFMKVHKPEFWMPLSIGENREGLRILQRGFIKTWISGSMASL